MSMYTRLLATCDISRGNTIHIPTLVPYSLPVPQLTLEGYQA
jgi:hypothetical protein